MSIHTESLTFEWGNLFSFRFWYAVGLGGFFVGVALMGLVAWIFPFELTDIPSPVFYSVMIPLWLFFAFVGLVGGALTCPACGKRVKQGFGVCHHCGFDQDAEDFDDDDEDMGKVMREVLDRLRREQGDA